MEATTELNLQAFCRFGKVLSVKMDAPWVIGGWEYATDGVICIRILTTKADGEKTGQPDAEALFKGFDPEKCDTPWLSGFVSDEIKTCCPQCDGDGYVYDVDGEQTRCIMCAGLGMAYVEMPRRINGIKIANLYDRLIQSLPGVQFSRADKPPTNKMIRFAFLGGQGAVMGLQE